MGKFWKERSPKLIQEETDTLNHSVSKLIQSASKDFPTKEINNGKTTLGSGSFTNEFY